MNTRTCIWCHKLKETEHGFYYIKRSESYDTRCKACVREYVRARNRKDGGEATRQAYQRRKAAGKAVNAPFAAKTPEQKRQAYEAVKRWREKHKERYSAESTASIALRRSIAYRRAWPLIVQQYGGKCLNCGSAKSLCFDHVVPLSQGGDNALANGQPLCRACNSFKGQTEPCRDHRPDKGAWIAELVGLNPWLSVIASGHKRGWHLTDEGKAWWTQVKEAGNGELLMPGGSGKGEGRRNWEGELVSSDKTCHLAIESLTQIVTSQPSLASDLHAIVAILNENPPITLCSDMA